MIDIENDVINMVAVAVRNFNTTVLVTSEHEPAQLSMPAVTVMEIDNTIVQRMRTTKIENADRVVYQINVYSDKANGRKAEAKSLMALVDNAMLNAGFTRIMMNQIPNLVDSRVYRIVARYSAVVGPGSQRDSYWIYQS